MADERDIQVRLQSGSLNGDELDIHSLVATDPISGLFSYRIEATRTPGSDFDEDALMLQPAWLSFATPDGEETHAIYGMVWSLREHAQPQVAEPVVEITLVPRAQSATMREMLDIFMEMTVPEIVEACLTRCGLQAGEHFDLSGLEESYLAKEFVVQYRETDFAFLSRLCEHHGIFYFVDHTSGKDVLTFGDRNTIFPTSERTPELPFRPLDTAGGQQYEHIQSVHIERKPLPKRYTVRDYNYRIPGVDLLSSADVDPAGLGEIVEYGAHFKGPDEGQWFANVRAQELLAEQRVFTCLGNPIAICAGQKFMLVEHPHGDVELLVTAVRHTIGGEGGESSATVTTITAIPAEITFRPRRRTPKPTVNGIITGMIDAGVKDGYADVDDQGRYRVRFMFDTAGRGEGQASRLVRMAQPHAGEGYGMHFPLRPNTEVILSCIDGDPDRPIITGTVPNPATVSPVSSANRDRNLIRTGGGNEIDISDEDGMHRIKMTTPHMGTVFQLGAENAAEVGAIITTHGNSVNQVAGTVGAMADFASTINDVFGSITAQSITSTAGIPDPIEGFEAVDKMLSSGAKAVASLAKTVDTIANFGKSLKDNSDKAIAKDKKSAEDAILALPTPQKYPDNARTVMVGDAPNQVPVTETEKQFRKRITDERIASGAASESQRSALESANSDAAGTLSYAGIGTIDGSVGDAYADSSFKAYLEGGSSALTAVSEATSGVAGAVKSVKKLFSNNHKSLQKAMDTVAKAACTTTAGGANLAAGESAPRTKVAVRLPGAHYNLITATDSVINDGLQAFYGMSPNKSYVYGGLTAMVASNKWLSLFGGLHAELAALQVDVTSTTLLDVESRQRIQMKSGTDTTLLVGNNLKIVTDVDTWIETKKKMEFKSVDLFKVEGGKEAKMEADKWFIEAKTAEYKVKVKTTFDVAADGDVKLQHKDKTRFLANTQAVMIENMQGGKYLATSSNAKITVKGGTSVDFAKGSVSVNGKSKVDVKASMINIKGKVMLG